MEGLHLSGHEILGQKGFTNQGICKSPQRLRVPGSSGLDRQGAFRNGLGSSSVLLVMDRSYKDVTKGLTRYEGNTYRYLRLPSDQLSLCEYPWVRHFSVCLLPARAVGGEGKRFRCRCSQSYGGLHPLLP